MQNADLTQDVHLKEDLETILLGIQKASLAIYALLQKSLGEYAQSTNATGDTQLKADVEADKNPAVLEDPVLDEGTGIQAATEEPKQEKKEKGKPGRKKKN